MTKNIRNQLGIPPRLLHDSPNKLRVATEAADLVIAYSCFFALGFIDQGSVSFNLFKHLAMGNILILMTAGFTFLLSADLLRLYRTWRWSRPRDHLFVLWSVWTFVALAVLLVAFNDAGRNSRADIIFYWVLLSPLLLTLWRLGIGFILRRLRSTGINIRRVCIVGGGESALLLGREIEASSQATGARLVGYFDDQPAQNSQVDLVGGCDDLIAKAFAGELDIVYLALSTDREAEIRTLIDQLANTAVSVHLLVPEIYEPVLYNEPREFGKLRTVSIYATPFENSINARLKRIEDLVLTSGILLVLALPMIVIAGLILITSGRPVIFRQYRYGLGGRPVEVWKFRSMTVDASKQKFKQAVANDPRVTRLGAILRKTSLDELPQLINVLQGSMSLVGPRPHPVDLNESFRGVIKSYMQRHSVKPGITGWAQVNGWRGETDELEKMEKRVEHDLYYIRHWSLLFDLEILIKTIFHTASGKNAH